MVNDVNDSFPATYANDLKLSCSCISQVNEDVQQVRLLLKYSLHTYIIHHTCNHEHYSNIRIRFTYAGHRFPQNDVQ